MVIQFDYVIVGAGSAGCAMANRLSADPRRRVLLLEAGGDDRGFWIQLPIGYGKSFYDEKVNWRFQSHAEAALGGRSIYFPRGKVLGGSSSINAMDYCRGLPGDFEDWRDAGNPGCGWEDVAPVLTRFERRVNASGAAMGDGALWVSDREADHHPVKRFFRAAAAEVGLPLTRSMNGSNPEGVGAYELNIQRGLRCSSATAFLRPAMHRRNLAVWQRAMAERIRFDGRRAIGVELRRDGAPLSVFARAEVILCAGAIGSPALLQLSGVGPATLLRAAGLSVIHANDGVGGALQDHLAIDYSYVATEPTLNQILGSWRGRVGAAIYYLIARRGPLSIGVNQLGGVVRSDPGKARADVQLYFNPVSYSTEWRGERRLLMPDPYAPPRIAPNYLSAEQDLRDAIAGARLIGRLQETTAMRALIAARPSCDPAAASEDEILADFRARATSVYHACGTCRMAPQTDRDVVDPLLRVYGIDGLRVADASIFPNITSANTNAPAIMVAQKAADLIEAG